MKLPPHKKKNQGGEGPLVRVAERRSFDRSHRTSESRPWRVGAPRGATRPQTQTKPHQHENYRHYGAPLCTYKRMAHHAYRTFPA